MLVKQFRTGYEAKSYLFILKKYYDKKIENQFESFETRGVEYGYILNEATEEIHDIEKIDFKELLEYKIRYSEDDLSFLEENNDKLKGGTIKFKLTDEASDKIDAITQMLSKKWNMRLYRAFSVKLILKYLYVRKIEKKDF
ncbi:phosphate:sodium symporter [Oceanobacillus picturae]|uniref:Phosphate:sodium symporter n=1 Tax=Oceanobacillus picturae TaxID=171693 RepID=A0A0U9HAF2_9BACI|nr:hypothetical protein [Oceanobacillus picturae]GAQ19487.1 phosphate:sodium symporter [Oceanobacillus picturae]